MSDANIISAKLFELEAEDREINAANAANVKAPKAESKSKAKPQLQPHRKATTSKAVVKAAPAQTRAVVAVVETKGTKSSLLADYVDKRKILVAKMLVDGKAMHAAVVDLKATARNVRITENQKSRGLGFQRSDAYFFTFFFWLSVPDNSRSDPRRPFTASGSSAKPSAGTTGSAFLRLRTTGCLL